MADPLETVRRRARMTLGGRVRARRLALNWTQHELARQAGINQGYLSEIERDRRRPSPQTLRALAVALDQPEGVLLGGGIEHDAPQPLETRELPLFGTIPAGHPERADPQMEMFPVLLHLWAEDRYCLKLALDSMEPTLKPGDIVLVQYRPSVDPALVQGRICACLLDGRSTLKRISVEDREGQRFVILRGDNPAIPPLVVRPGQDFAIQGVVIKLVSRDL